MGRERLRAEVVAELYGQVVVAIEGMDQDQKAEVIRAINSLVVGMSIEDIVTLRMVLRAIKPSV